MLNVDEQDVESGFRVRRRELEIDEGVGVRRDGFRWGRHRKSTVVLLKPN